MTYNQQQHFRFTALFFFVFYWFYFFDRLILFHWFYLLQNCFQSWLVWISSDWDWEVSNFVLASMLLSWQQTCFVATNMCFVATNACLSRQNFCRDKNDTCGSSRQWQSSAVVTTLGRAFVSFNLSLRERMLSLSATDSPLIMPDQANHYRRYQTAPWLHKKDFHE